MDSPHNVNTSNNNSSDVQSSPAQELRFFSTCKLMNLDSPIVQRAWKLLQTLLPHIENKFEEEKYWFACALYVTNLELSQSNDSESLQCIRLEKLLEYTNTSLTDLFEPLQEFIVLLKLDKWIKRNIKDLKKNFIFLHLFYKKYYSFFQEYFNCSENVANDSCFKFGWYLFLDCREALRPETSSDLVSVLSLFISCVHFLFYQCPKEKLKFKDEEGKTAIEILENFCTKFSASNEHVLQFYISTFLPHIEQLLSNKVLQLSTSDEQPMRDDQCNLDVLETMKEILQPEMLKLNAESMTSRFEEKHKNTLYFENLFFTYKLIGHSANLPSPLSHYLPIPNFDLPSDTSLNNTQTTTSSSSYPVTPLSTTMNSITWLSSSFRSPVTASPNLLRFFTAGKEDLTEQIANRVTTLLSRVSFSCDEHHRRDLIAFRFYTLLELMLEQEEKRLQKTDFTTLLQLESFHKSILAVCTVITMFAFKVESSYLTILEIFQIDPFEFSKVTDNVIRLEQKMPLEIQRHLQSIEEHIFECSAWKENSPVFHLLSRDGQQKFLELQLLQSPNRTPNKVLNYRSLMSPKTPSSSSSSYAMINLLQSPYSGSGKAANNNAAAPPSAPSTPTPPPPPSPSSSSTPATPSTPSTPSSSSSSSGKSRSLELFYRKVANLANYRIKHLCQIMQLQGGAVILHSMFHTLLFTLIWHPEIICGRHIDQMIICTIYGVCRATNQADVTFKKILDAYRSFRPQFNSKLYRDILITAATNTRGDIIDLYNNVFIPKVESHLLQLQKSSHSSSLTQTQHHHHHHTTHHHSNNNTHPPPPPMQPNFLSQSPIKVPKFNVNINVSASPSKTLYSSSSYKGSIHSPHVYNVGQSPTSDLRAINKHIQRPERKGRKLLFDDPEDVPIMNSPKKIKIEPKRSEELAADAITQLSKNSEFDGSGSPPKGGSIPAILRSNSILTSTHNNNNGVTFPNPPNSPTPTSSTTTTSNNTTPTRKSPRTPKPKKY